ncbi:LARP6 [Bugula neritina]|uniref:LARP6 n=1 Tax=Bugula neritina TaxID=10212 RepID=A0A7J7JGU4_BUGNE|nr:LARP6 [Bugula neritina]
MDFYFSDANILKDSFLLKHVRRNKEGYVNLKLITSFKKMKALTKDYRVVAYSLRKYSKVLLVNEAGNKARRHDPLPDYDETKSSRTVIAFNLPEEQKLTTETISSLFKHCGDIAMVQIIKPGKSISSDIKKHVSKHIEAGETVCAVIEFEKHENAVKALSLSADPSKSPDKTLKVVMLNAPAAKVKAGDDSESDSEFQQKRRNKKKTVRSAERDREGFSSGSEGDFLMPRPRNTSFGSENGKVSRTTLSPTHAERSWNSPNGNGNSNQRRRSVPLPQSPLADPSKNSPKASPKPSPKTSPRASPEMRRRANSGGMAAASDLSNSPWVQRRMQASREMSPLAKAGSRKAEAVIRAPRGPESDKGKGFYGGHGRGKPLQTVTC